MCRNKNTNGSISEVSMLLRLSWWKFHRQLDRVDTDRDGWIQINYDQFMNVSSNLVTAKFFNPGQKKRWFLVLLDVL